MLAPAEVSMARFKRVRKRGIKMLQLTKSTIRSGYDKCKSTTISLRFRNVRLGAHQTGKFASIHINKEHDEIK